MLAEVGERAVPEPKHEKRPKTMTEPRKSFDPYTFVKIWERTPAGSLFPIYDPTNPPDSKIRKPYYVDESSEVEIELDPTRMSPDIPLNRVYISAKLSSNNSSGSSSTDLPVVGYSEIGKPKEGEDAQHGVSFATAADIQARLMTMLLRSADILHYVYRVPEDEIIDFQAKGVKEADEKILIELRKHQTEKDGTEYQEDLVRLRERIRLYQPEISSNASFLSDNANKPIVEILGVQVLQIDWDTLSQISKQIQDNLTAAFDDKSSPSAKAAALQVLWERNKRLYRDFMKIRIQIEQIKQTSLTTSELELQKNPASTNLAAIQQELRSLPEISRTMTIDSAGAQLCPPLRLTGASRSQADTELTPKRKRLCDLAQQYAAEEFARHLKKLGFDSLILQFARGSVSLREAKATDGNLLNLTIEALGADSASGGIPASFKLSVRRYGIKKDLSDSLLFLKRVGLSRADKTPAMAGQPPPLNDINFAPSPGATFGFIYYKRGNTNWDKFVHGLAPGVGINVSFMNFNDPGFDLSTGMFTNTKGTDIQTGAGLVVSLFDNAIQFSRGWNLNVDRRRQYFGVGFSFVKVVEKVKSVVSKP